MTVSNKYEDAANEKRMRTQRWLIREHLRTGKPITPLGALTTYGAFRLAAVIHLLRGEGMNIITTMKHSNGKHYASYQLLLNN